MPRAARRLLLLAGLAGAAWWWRDRQLAANERRWGHGAGGDRLSPPSAR